MSVRYAIPDSVSDTLTLKIERKQNRPTLKYNDQYLLITVKEILERSTPSVAREFASALSDYYMANGNTYPAAVRRS